MKVLGSKTVHTLELDGSELRALYDILNDYTKKHNIGLYDNSQIADMKREIMHQFEDLSEELLRYELAYTEQYKPDKGYIYE